MRVRQDKHGRKDNIGMACLATKEQAKLAINMLNKSKQYVANEYKHRKQTNNLNNNAKEKDKRYKKLNSRKQRPAMYVDQNNIKRIPTYVNTV